MTLISEIIQRAYRESNVITIGTSPTAAEIAEALPLLNSLILSTVGNEASEQGFQELIVGGEFDQSNSIGDYIPDNTRLVLNLSASDTLELTPYPYEGQQFSVIDALGNLATYPLTIDANGRSIEGSSTLVLSTNDLSRRWMYRADTANWVRIASLSSSDTLPFPEEFDDYFIIMLALRINPRHGVTLTPETSMALNRARRNLRSRYSRQLVKAQTDPGLLPSGGYSENVLDTTFDRGF